ncbi:MAG: hypothetical protein M1817_001124 [Caeruleum heppii]|nr:MAG: hypothetical protein M1817_001124 [Caeruleum heppii]
MAAPLEAQSTDPIEEDDYHTSEDEDFDPTAPQPGAEAESSASEDEEDNPQSSKPGTSTKIKKRKGTATYDDDENGVDLDFENSGDEATIRRGKRKRRGAEGPDDDDEGGEGGLIKTRAQRAQEGKGKKPLVDAKGATVDVDSLWASMTAATPVKPPSPTRGIPNQINRPNATHTTPDASTESSGREVSRDLIEHQASPSASQDPNMMKIKRTYKFAGETVTEEKLVPKDSAEARLYLESQNQPALSGKPAVRRPKKRSSMFDPNPAGAANGASTSAGATKGPKLNTIEKSKLDWAGFVDKEGIAEELDDHSRAKDGYLGRMDFLGRVEANRAEEMKQGRKA